MPLTKTDFMKMLRVRNWTEMGCASLVAPAPDPPMWAHVKCLMWDCSSEHLTHRKWWCVHIHWIYNTSHISRNGSHRRQQKVSLLISIAPSISVSYVKIQMGSRPFQNVTLPLTFPLGVNIALEKRKLTERGLSSVFFFLSATKKKVFMMNVFSSQCWMAMSKLRAEHQYGDNMKNNINR